MLKIGDVIKAKRKECELTQEELAAFLGVDMNKTVAVGDFNNDISMRRAAGVGVAVDNANADVKTVADYITVEQFGFNKRCSATSELVENQIPLLRISENDVSRNIRRPVSSPFCIMCSPITTLWE